jgi:hypothetical protein
LDRLIRAGDALSLDPEQLRNAGAVDVNVEHGHAPAALGQIDGESCGHGTLADSALPGQDEDLVLDMGELPVQLLVLVGLVFRWSSGRDCRVGCRLCFLPIGTSSHAVLLLRR